MLDLKKLEGDIKSPKKKAEDYTRTTITVNKELYNKAKPIIKENQLDITKFITRCLSLFINDDSFKNLINNHSQTSIIE